MTGKSSTVLIVGAASDIGRALAREYAKAGASLILAARRVERLAPDVEDLKLRYGTAVRLAECDLLDLAGHERFLDALGEPPDIALCVVGLLGQQQAAEADSATADLIMRSNYNGPALLLNALAARMERRGSGHIIGISSVAGDRGRASNYVYGSAKAGFTAFLSGLRNRLAGKGVAVLTVKPGFVDTRMTEGMALPPLLTAKPVEVAQAVRRAQERGRDVLYVRPIWRVIMLVIRLLPEALFKRMRI